MKGTSFQKPLEFNLRVNGESWHQGDQIEGTLTIKNHGLAAVSLTSLKMQLAHGDLKKVRLKTSGGFREIASAQLDLPQCLESSQEITIPWNFQTDRNCPITDTFGSLFLLYGLASINPEEEKLAHLQLPFLPFKLVLEFVELFGTAFRFVLKGQKWSKGQVEFKLAAPAARGFATLDLLLLKCSFQNTNLMVKYEFQVKKIEATAASFEVKKIKKDLEQLLSATEYQLPSGRLNHERLEIAIREALSSVESKISF